jgi:hypothetical protein
VLGIVTTYPGADASHPFTYDVPKEKIGPAVAGTILKRRKKLKHPQTIPWLVSLRFKLESHWKL